MGGVNWGDDEERACLLRLWKEGQFRVGAKSAGLAEHRFGSSIFPAMAWRCPQHRRAIPLTIWAKIKFPESDSPREGHLNPVLAPGGEILSATKTFHGFRPTGQPADVQSRSKRQVRGKKKICLEQIWSPVGSPQGLRQESRKTAYLKKRLAGSRDLLRSPAALASPGQTFRGLPVRLSAHPLRFSLAGRGQQKGHPLPFADALHP